MVSPFAADDDHDAAFASTEDAVTPSDDDETVGPRSEVVHDDVDVDEGVIPEDDVKVIAPARPVPTHLRALPPVEPPTAARDRKSTRLNSSHSQQSRMPSSA